MTYKFIKTDNYEIYNYDCIEIMDLLIAEGKQVDLIVTSPPYDDLRDYENSLVWNFDVFKQVAQRLYDITKDGGVVVWVVNDKTKNKSETLTSFKQVLYFKEIGFNVHDTMIWKKTAPPPQTKEGKRYTLATEYMFILTKGSIKTFNPIMTECKMAGVKHGRKSGQRKKDGTIREDRVLAREGTVVNMLKPLTNIWEISHSTYKGHPAVFPEKLAQDHILSWSNEGDTVLDCFMGSATTGKMALLNNRKFIGIEKVEDYFEISKQRIEESLHKETS